MPVLSSEPFLITQFEGVFGVLPASVMLPSKLSKASSMDSPDTRLPDEIVYPFEVRGAPLYVFSASVAFTVMLR